MSKYPREEVGKLSHTGYYALLQPIVNCLSTFEPAPIHESRLRLGYLLKARRAKVRRAPRPVCCTASFLVRLESMSNSFSYRFQNCNTTFLDALSSIALQSY